LFAAHNSAPQIVIEIFMPANELGNSHTWEDFVVEALSMLGYGFAPHEIVYKRRLGRRL